LGCTLDANPYLPFTARLQDAEKSNDRRSAPMDAVSPRPLPRPSTPAASPELRRQAEELEAAFLSEMLKHSGLEAMGGAFSGGEGEAQFTSFLRDAQARLIVAKGGIGLSESLVTALAGRIGAP
jgi:peptidoglycan hydrolase FlgJ